MIENFLNSCRRHREMLRFSVLAIFIIWVVWQLHSSPYILHPSSVEDVRRWVASYGSLGPLVYIALYTVRPVLFFPSIFFKSQRQYFIWTNAGYRIFAVRWSEQCCFMLCAGKSGRRQEAARSLWRLVG